MTTILDEQHALYIDGDWRRAHNHGELTVHNPATGQILANIGFGGRQDAEEAVAAAESAFAKWRKTTARERAKKLQRVADLLRDRKEKIGRILALESGKRLQEAVGEVRFSAEYFQWFAEEARRSCGGILTNEDPQKRHSYIHQPAGVAVCLTPWNFPVSIQARKLAPALAAGCTVVARASQKAPLSVIELFRCIADADFPAGVVNLIQGPAAETTDVFLTHPAVRVVSFTGSTSVGQRLIAASSHRVLKLALELGGNAPYIVFDDANIDKALEGFMVAKFRNNGQSCIAANRIYIHEHVYDEFISKLVDRVSGMRIGDPMHSETDLGPMIDKGACGALQDRIENALQTGAHNILPKLQIPDEGSYIPPALLTGVQEGTDFAESEIFGPASPLFRFHDEGEVLQSANRSDMGLAAYAYTQDYARGVRVSEALEYGIVALNHALPSVAFAPMGGWKLSGLGREGAHIGMEEFQEIKYVSVEI